MKLDEVTSFIEGLFKRFSALWAPVGAVLAALGISFRLDGRQRHAVVEFASWAVSDKRILTVIVVSFVCLCASVLGRRSASSLVRVYISSLSRSTILALVTLVLFAINAAVDTTRWKYREFSESTSQLDAISLWRRNRRVEAIRVCERYLRNYPYRSSTGSIPDPVCVPLAGGTEDLVRLAAYAKGQRGNPVLLGDRRLPFGWRTREEILRIGTSFESTSDSVRATVSGTSIAR